MAEITKIAWTDATFNPWKICTPIGTGCLNCYAAALSIRYGWGEYKQGVPRQRTSAANWRKPLTWQRHAEKGLLPDGKTPHGGRAPRVFCASLADVFDNEAPDEWRHELFDLIEQTPNLSWLLVTKRIGNVPKMAYRWLLKQEWPDNCRLLITVVNQEEADRDIPKLLALPCKNGISYEPALSYVDWSKYLKGSHVIDSEERSIRLRSGESGESSDRDRRHDMASARHSQNTDRIETASIIEVSDRESETQRQASFCGSSPPSVSPLCGADTSGDDDKSQGRRHNEQSPGQPRDRHVCRAGSTRDHSSWAKAEGSERGAQRHGETDGGGCPADSQTASSGGTPNIDSQRLRNQISGGIEDRPRRQVGRIDWLIVGGESSQGSHKARPFNIAWARSTIQQCRAAGVPVFMKQIGSQPRGWCAWNRPECIGSAEAARLRNDAEDGDCGNYEGHEQADHCEAYGARCVMLKNRAGADPAEWPVDVRVREFPV